MGKLRLTGGPSLWPRPPFIPSSSFQHASGRMFVELMLCCKVMQCSFTFALRKHLKSFMNWNAQMLAGNHKNEEWDWSLEGNCLLNSFLQGVHCSFQDRSLLSYMKQIVKGVGRPQMAEIIISKSAVLLYYMSSSITAWMNVLALRWTAKVTSFSVRWFILLRLLVCTRPLCWWDWHITPNLPLFAVTIRSTSFGSVRIYLSLFVLFSECSHTSPIAKQSVEFYRVDYASRE